MSGIEHRIVTREPSDCIRGACRVPDCPGYPSGDGRSHGIASEEVAMYVIGQHHTGPIAVNFTYSTGRYHDLTPRDAWGKPMGYDIGHHATVASYEGQYCTDACELVGGKCFYDGSSLAADRYLAMLQNYGEDALWGALDDYLAEFSASLTESIREMGGVLR